ncbi:hypothetical protein M0R45_009080 [Rubus argutus]|uniref:Uncharacterized protein n=1 Tax=Rubus argutus TaxID=59490 RepID=A0AAW1Y3X6_RUBAR
MLPDYSFNHPSLPKSPTQSPPLNSSSPTKHHDQPHPRFKPPSPPSHEAALVLLLHKPPPEIRISPCRTQTTHHEPANFTRNTHQSKFSRELYVLKSTAVYLKLQPSSPTTIKPIHGSFSALIQSQARSPPPKPQSLTPPSSIKHHHSTESRASALPQMPLQSQSPVLGSTPLPAHPTVPRRARAPQAPYLPCSDQTPSSTHSAITYASSVCPALISQLSVQKR